MSKFYCQKFNVQSDPTTSPEMRVLCTRPGRVDENGDIQYTTEQSHKDQCNINNIIQKYDKHGLITHVSRFEASFGDVSGADFKAMADKVAAAKSAFNNLPSKIRNRFANDPTQLLSFMDNPNNRDEAIKLGLISPLWSPDQDGLGEHIVRDKDGKVVEPAKE